jgi:hypothetical protein
MISLSAHFSLEEATASQTAARLGIMNVPSDAVLANMKKAALQLELVRMELNSNAIHISSWYRSPALNAAVGSKPTSAHITGWAIDFTCPTFGKPDRIIQRILASKVDFDQVINEYDSWVHISFDGNRKQALVIDRNGTRAFV